MKYWNELRVVYLIGLHGTATSAAKALDVHRTTVIRQLDFLEQKLQQKLFIRHNKGFTLNEAGTILFDALEQSEQKLRRSVGILEDIQDKMSGELVIASVDRVLFLLNNTLRSFLNQHPNIRLKLEPNPLNSRLEYGEAHIAVVPDIKPDMPDYIIQKFCSINLALYANKAYVEKYGLPKSEMDFKHHKFAVCNLPQESHLRQYINQNIPSENIIFSCTEPSIVENAVLSGIGIGFMMKQYASSFGNLIEVFPSRQGSEIPMWLVTHIDIHQVPKVSACVNHLKKWAATCS